MYYIQSTLLRSSNKSLRRLEIFTVKKVQSKNFWMVKKLFSYLYYLTALTVNFNFLSFFFFRSYFQSIYQVGFSPFYLFRKTCQLDKGIPLQTRKFVELYSEQHLGKKINNYHAKYASMSIIILC